MNTKDDLRNNIQLIKDVNNRVPFLWECFDNIIRYKNRSFIDTDIDESVNAVFQNFISIVKLVPLMAVVIDIPQVVRGQKNTKGEPVFSTKSRISYNRSRMNLIEFGRFNRKGEPLFYASLPTETTNVDYVLSCALECCKELTAEIRNYKFQDITVGGWLVKDPFPVINLCFDDEHLKENPALRTEVHNYLDIIAECFSPEASKFIKSFLYYFSELSGTLAESDFHYFAPTALFCAIRYYYENVVEEPKFGLIYPGAMSDKKGLNIVMTCEAVDRFLKLDKIVMYRYCPVYGGRTDCIAEPCSDIVHPDKMGNFVITNYKHPAP